MINKKILNEIVSEFKENEKDIEKIVKIESKYSNLKFDINKVIEIIKNFKSDDINLNQKNMVIYYGNPYTTINICLESIYKNIELYLIAEENFLGLNKTIVQIFNNVLKDYKMKQIKIDFFEPEFNLSKFISTNEFDKIINLGNYNRINDLKSKNIEFELFDYGNCIVLNDSEEYLDLLQDFLSFTYEASFETECINTWEEDLKYILEYLDNKENKDKIVIYFTNNTNKDNSLYIKLKDKENSFINKNPFKNWNYKIPNIFNI